MSAADAEPPRAAAMGAARGGLVLLTALGAAGAAAPDGVGPGIGPAAAGVFADTALRAYVQPIPGTPLSFEMVPVPGGTVGVAAPEGSRTVEVAPFWIAKTELTWEIYDLYVFGREDGGTTAAEGVAAVSHPTKPYVLPGEGFGHEGHPALAMTFHAANGFARWISGVTGREYRLPTEAEWRLACRLGAAGGPDAAADAPGDAAARPASGDEAGAAADSRGWHRGNARGRTQPVGSLAPDALGLHDLLGNVAEWAAGADGGPVALGGAWDDEPADVHCGARRKRTSAWNATDPQLPKSRWWLSDAPFVGLRLVRAADAGDRP